MANNIIDKIQISGQSYNVKDSSAATVVELTQQEYDALPSSAKTGNTLFVITDAQAGDLTNYYTKTETNTLLGGLKLKKLTQAEYDALSPNYDSNTLYVVTDS